MRGRGALGKPGVVEQQVDVGEARRQVGHRPHHGGVVADVEYGRVHLLGPELVHQQLQPFGAAPAGNHAPARLREPAHRRGTEAGGRAGDEGGLDHGQACAYCARIAIAGRPPLASFCLASASSLAVP